MSPADNAFLINHNKLRFPLLSDFEPKGEVARLYEVYQADKGTSERALIVIDEEGIIHWRHISPGDVNPGANGILDALQRMKEGQEGN